MKHQIEYIKVKDLQLNPNNPRHNDEAVKSVALSIQKYGFNNPLIVWNGDVYCGNTRLKAAQELGLEEVPCIVVNELTEQQIREYALIDNKTNEIAEWDYDMLQEELDVLDLGEFDLDWGVADFVEENEKDKPDMQFPEILGEEHNYIVLYFDNDVDYLQAESLFGLPKVMNYSTRTDGKITEGMKSYGLGRVVKGRDAIDKIMGVDTDEN